ncbi:ferredoxin [Pseudonocardia pini]|uniref:ferredoxin n=1 Tax=Pseudonocardia pini TaxID=2758030 RepID=UPI0015EFE5A9|nr:ferredoxin [Pseudonocardia pini]
MRLTVDYDLCTGHGRCYMLYPDLYDADDSGDAVVLLPIVPTDREQEALESVDCCPEGAIVVELDPPAAEPPHEAGGDAAVAAPAFAKPT